MQKLIVATIGAVLAIAAVISSASATAIGPLFPERAKCKRVHIVCVVGPCKAPCVDELGKPWKRF